MKKLTQITLIVGAILLGIFIAKKTTTPTTNTVVQFQPCVMPNPCGRTIV